MEKFGLYIHIPFCKNKCPYCSFYSVTDADDNIIDSYLSACLREIETVTAGKSIDTVYIGGGTPSHIGEERLCNFINSVSKLINYNGVEFTVEVNPESITDKLCELLNDTVVNRISVGVQSFDNNVLNLLGRIHNAEKALQAIDTISKYMPKTDISIDLIYDIPNVDFDIAAKSLQIACDTGAVHISAYSYMPDTGYLTDSASENPFQMEKVMDYLAERDYEQYEVSNYSKKGKTARHNSKYWNMLPYLGIGAGAHSMLIEEGHRVRYCHKNDISQYIQEPILRENIEIYSEVEALKESIVFGLRQISGIDYIEISKKSSIIKDVLLKIDTLCKEGMLTCSRNKVRVTKKGLLLLDSVMSYLW